MVRCELAMTGRRASLVVMFYMEVADAVMSWTHGTGTVTATTRITLKRKLSAVSCSTRWATCMSLRSGVTCDLPAVQARRRRS